MYIFYLEKVYNILDLISAWKISGKQANTDCLIRRLPSGVMRLEVSRKVTCGLWSDAKDLEKLCDTMEAFRNACNHASKIAYDEGIHKPKALRDLTYRALRANFKLPASLAPRAVNRVAASYKEDPWRLHTFENRSIPLDGRLFSLRRNEDFQALIVTIRGRVKVNLCLSEYQRELLKNAILGARLILKRTCLSSTSMSAAK